MILADPQFLFLIRTGESEPQEFLLQGSPGRLFSTDPDESQHAQQCPGR
jgi:hypothetical protein